MSNMAESIAEALSDPLVADERRPTAQRMRTAAWRAISVAKQTMAFALLFLGALATLAWVVFLGWAVGPIFRFW